MMGRPPSVVNISSNIQNIPTKHSLINENNGMNCTMDIRRQCAGCNQTKCIGKRENCHDFVCSFDCYDKYISMHQQLLK